MFVTADIRLNDPILTRLADRIAVFTTAFTAAFSNE